MRRLLLLLVLLIPLKLFAPTMECMTIIVSDKPINYYDIIADAVYKVESNCDSLAYNPVEDAVGGFQIRPIRVKDYNTRTGNNYKLKDFYSLTLSRTCFMYYAKLNNDTETIVKRWNGSGKKTITYWNKVKQYL